MASTVFPAAGAASKTRYVVTLLSGTSWTVPAGVTYVNARLYGAGGGGQNGMEVRGGPGQIVTTNVATTPANTVAYTIGAGGGNNTAGGNTTFTGATTASGGTNVNSNGNNGPNGEGADNGGYAGGGGAGTGGSGKIELEYWV